MLQVWQRDLDSPYNTLELSITFDMFTPCLKDFKILLCYLITSCGKLKILDIPPLPFPHLWGKLSVNMAPTQLQQRQAPHGIPEEHPVPSERVAQHRTSRCCPFYHLTGLQDRKCWERWWRKVYFLFQQWLSAASLETRQLLCKRKVTPPPN